MSTTVKVASIPKCDLCKEADAIVDGRTAFGPWAYMCKRCWLVRGVGRLGTGYGQKLELAAS